ncbi:hypothetical protein [Streptomyces sp. JJ38]|uniref:hypothetical protein n=1 Tax=Streptomyces sp. JJ38 TaxID=2738128 RepID=UPI001C585A83|nr:hypothetical protein [Streptomyces sp. JJ38]MBW1597100.1 hypothetical protein [Streptomyces sp. JJ38]
MASLVWLLIPLAGVISAAFWASWAARQSPENGSGDAAGVAGYDAFRNAMESAAADRYRIPARSAAAPGTPQAPPASSPDAPPPRTARPERAVERRVP